MWITGSAVHRQSPHLSELSSVAPQADAAMVVHTLVITDEERSVDEHEARLRLAAIARWVEHAQAGDCPVEIAVQAVMGLAVAAQGFLAKSAAA